MRNTEVFKKHLRERRAVQIIDYGFSLENIKQVSIAAQMGMASSVCVNAFKQIVQVAKRHTKLPVFCASYNPFKLLEGMKAGADGIVIGNYDDLYRQSSLLSAREIYEIVIESMNMTQKYNPFVAVTIPGYLEASEQIILAKKLELLGVDMIQTEGSIKFQSRAIKGSDASAKISIENTIRISSHVGLPIMTTSGLTPDTVPLAFSSGAQGVGIGSCVNKMDTQAGMTTMVRNIVSSVVYNRRASRELREESINSFVPFLTGL